MSLLNKQNGITLIALVITIIIMLILAGVSISAIVGEDGILSRASKATETHKKAEILEAIDLELASYNIDTILSNPVQINSILKSLINKEIIDTVLSASGQTTDVSEALAIPQFDENNNYTGYIDYGVMKDNCSILLSVDGTGIYKARFGEVNISSGGSVSAGTTVVTKEAFYSESDNEADKGKFTIDKDASVMFVDEIEGELSIQVKNGTHAKVNIFKDMTLTNEGIERSAIDLESNATLDLFVAEGTSLNVNSGFGKTGETAIGLGAAGGPGGYAGIHVPESAMLNLYGKGNIIAFGGNAGDGGGAVSNNTGGGGGRRGWSWNRWKWWKWRKS